MPSGTLEVVLASAQGLKSGDFFSKTDAYAVISCGNQTERSNVARNKGSNPVWNQKFVFSIEDGISEITLRIMDEDLITADDELGCVTVPLATVFYVGKTATTSYNVVQKSGKFKGEVKLSLAFTPKQRADSFQGGYYNAHSSVGASTYSIGQGPYGSGGGGGWNQGAL